MSKTAAIVSLSSGVLGEDFMAHERALGEKRLAALGYTVKYMPHALAGLSYIKDHPEARAADLLAAFRDESVDLILCAIGGDDTYRLLPYLFGNDELKNALRKKIFLGFSDTTYNHFMLHKLGLPTFYGQSYLSDVCELEDEMLPYSRRYFEELLLTGRIERVTPSELWYDERTSFGVDQLGVPRSRHPNGGWELLQGASRFSGKILGGCICSIYDMFDGERYADCPVLVKQYGLFPAAEDWKGRILLLESSEEQPSPEKYRRGLEYLKSAGVFGVVSGVLIGKPMDEKYFDEYKQLLREVIDDPALPVLANLSIGHATPRCILPFGVTADVDADAQSITFRYE